MRGIGWKENHVTEHRVLNDDKKFDNFYLGKIIFDFKKNFHPIPVPENKGVTPSSKHADGNYALSKAV